jgi:hypothetical protein
MDCVRNPRTRRGGRASPLPFRTQSTALGPPGEHEQGRLLDPAGRRLTNNQPSRKVNLFSRTSLHRSRRLRTRHKEGTAALARRTRRSRFLCALLALRVIMRPHQPASHHSRADGTAVSDTFQCLPPAIVLRHPEGRAIPPSSMALRRPSPRRGRLERDAAAQPCRETTPGPRFPGGVREGGGLKQTLSAAIISLPFHPAFSRRALPA